MSWLRFEAEAPAIARAGRRLLTGADGGTIAFLATGAAAGPHLSPVCPFWSGGELVLIASAQTPKARDLQADPRYALHAFLGDADEEFQVRGSTVLVSDSSERTVIHRDVPFASFGRDDPIYRLAIGSALHVHWERVGQPDTRAVRVTWKDGTE